MMESIIFWVFATFSVVAALGVVFHKSIIYSALFLIAAFLSIAGIFVLNNADFLAVAQTVVYGVGLTIVILFGIMFTGDQFFNDSAVTKRQLLAYLIVSLMTFGVLLPAAQFAYSVIPTPPMLREILITDGSTRLLGFAMFNQYALPFEVASVLLLAAMVGAILISKKRFEGEEESSIKYTPSDSALTDEARGLMESTLTSLAASKPADELDADGDDASTDNVPRETVEV